LKQVLLVGLGGFVGSIGRYLLGGLVLHQTTGWRFPLSTFCVNVIGCFTLGALAGVAERHAIISADARLFLFTGLLGGFTTFSAFGAEGVNLVRRGDIGVAIAYAALSVVSGFAAVWIGMKLFGVGFRHE
jgi:CrcB protein